MTFIAHISNASSTPTFATFTCKFHPTLYLVLNQLYQLQRVGITL